MIRRPISIAVLMVALMSSPTFALVGGRRPNAESLAQQATVGLYWRDRAGQLSLGCSGVLIQGGYALTARHCVSQWKLLRALFDPVIDADDFDAPILVSRVTKHPSLDLATLHLAGDPCKTRKCVAASDVWKGLLAPSAKLWASGYGFRDAKRTQLDGVFVGRQLLRASSSRAVETSGSGSSVCKLDSGGPLWIRVGGKCLLVGILSNADAGCRGLRARFAPIYRYSSPPSFRHSQALKLDVRTGIRPTTAANSRKASINPPAFRASRTS